MSTSLIEDALVSARNSVKNSRQSSELAKDFMDAGYPNRQRRDNAVEALRQSIEQLADAVEDLTILVTRHENTRYKRFRRYLKGHS